MKRIQRKRTAGWHMPSNTVYVGRPTKFGNPFALSVWTRADAIREYETWLRDKLVDNPHFLDELKGKDLACWCPLDEPCHADVILKLLNDNKKIVLSEEDRKALAELYHRAETTPMIWMGGNTKDWSRQAWDEVRAKMDELGKKYGFDPRQMKGISSKTGEVST